MGILVHRVKPVPTLVQNLWRLAGEIFAEVEGSLTIEGFHRAEGRDFLRKEAIAIGEKQSASWQEISVQLGIPLPHVIRFASTSNDRLGWRRKSQIKRDKHLGNRRGHSVKGLPACRQDLFGARFRISPPEACAPGGEDLER